MLLISKIEEVGRPRDLDEDDDLVVDIMTGPRTIAEESYTLPVIMDPEEVSGQTASWIEDNWREEITLFIS